MKTLNNKKKANLIFIIILVAITTAACASLGVQPRHTPTVSNLDSKQPKDTSPPFGESEPQGDYRLEAELSLPERVPLCDPVELEFKVTNQSDQAVYLLKWYTPLEGVLGNIFRVTYEGQERAYLGPLVMRGAPLPEQYILLEVGESATAVVDISTVYDFSTAGHYTIAFKSPRISHAVDDMARLATSVDELGPVQIPSQPVEVEIVAPENGEEDCAAAALPAVPGQGNEPELTLTGVVREVSPSAQVIWLQAEVAGFTTVALTADSTMTTASGKPLELNQIQPGLTIRVTGQPGKNQALLAHSVQLVPPEEK